MKNFLKRLDIFLNRNFYFGLGILFCLFIVTYIFNVGFSINIFGNKINCKFNLMPIAEYVTLAFAMLLALDLIIAVLPNYLFDAKRTTAEKWSLGDENTVFLEIRNNGFLPMFIEIIDELPEILQKRNFVISHFIAPKQLKKHKYTVLPHKRGDYDFGDIRIFAKSLIGFFARRYTIPAQYSAAVYPSIIQMKKYQLITLEKIAKNYGVKRMRRLGHSYEFEQIKDYVQGDDIRNINWKATGRFGGQLKTNHFIEEKSQPVYCIIDKSRVMNMAFNHISLLDYSINASLVISNTSLQKGDRAGLITFSDKVGSAIKADSKPGQLRGILESLYNQKYRQCESDFEFLFNATSYIIKSRSLLFLFTNFESTYSLERVKPILRKLNNRHLLVVIFFENSEIEDYAYSVSTDLKNLHTKIIAQKFLVDKRTMAADLNNYGIQTILTKPEELTINTLNKYLELKAKGLI